jgi:FixJ family two-component response regulator
MIQPGRVIVVDDDEGFRTSTERFLRSVGYDVETYADPAPLLDTSRDVEPTCMLLDLRMPGMSGLEAQQELARHGYPHPIIFMSAHADVRASVQAMKHGAFDFLVKPFDEQQLLDAIARSLSQDARAHVSRGARQHALERLDRLTSRERQVSERLMRGLLNKQIAWELGIAESTVKVHRSRMMAKLGVDSVVALMRLLDRASVAAASSSSPPDPVSDGITARAVR